jgi:hypothetical protein
MDKRKWVYGVMATVIAGLLVAGATRVISYAGERDNKLTEVCTDMDTFKEVVKKQGDKQQKMSEDVAAIYAIVKIIERRTRGD